MKKISAPKRLWRISFLLLFVFLSQGVLATPTPKAAYPDDYHKLIAEKIHGAAALVGTNFLQIAARMQAAGFDPKQLFSIVFPELIRYSMFQDMIEKMAVISFYVRFGSAMADFSIGPFQMKPSFAEKIESFIMKHKLLIVGLSSTLELEKNLIASHRRELRARRLASILDQTGYLIAFFKVVGKLFPEISSKGILYQVQFYAAAYNAGPDKERSQIMAAMNREGVLLSFGSPRLVLRYSYTRLAALFYSAYWNEFVKILVRKE